MQRLFDFKAPESAYFEDPLHRRRSLSFHYEQYSNDDR